ncbi:DNA-binding protein [Halobacteriales archaeon SW_8_65_20]|nr:MAG: DNA-binding protein [Halobacteriales archaeon QH_7_65_31]PSQ31977.1 MAG: DNA-binding protein [Halobacteriales archaeon SW_6_65_46]PSQ52946.1 MAG: DNA-binding protein [Halobacteriales archaeon SW_8_65_20]
MSQDDEEIDELRQERLEQLKEQQQSERNSEAREQQRQQAEAQKKAALRKTLTDSARQRLNSVKMSKPEFAEQVEQQVVALSRSGRVQGKIDDEQMKSLLSELQPDKQEFNIKRR